MRQIYYLGDHPCDIAVDWCGWKSVHGWERIRYKELDQGHQDGSGDDNVNENLKDYENGGGKFDTGIKEGFLFLALFFCQLKPAALIGKEKTCNINLESGIILCNRQERD